MTYSGYSAGSLGVLEGTHHRLISAEKIVKQRTSLDALCDLFLENPKFW